MRPLVEHNPFMISDGVYPAAVTPFDEKGRIDMAAVARLLAWFESRGCTGAVLAGTNGEGPSLSAPEKRDLLRDAMTLRGKLDLILGVATPSLDEALWLCSQAGKLDCAGVLLMPPFYFRDASQCGIEGWLSAVLDASPAPIIVYNFPQKAGVTIAAETLSRLSSHPNLAGVKDSSGAVENIASYREALEPHHKLFMGNETLLWHALEAGWSGTISGASNVLPNWLSQIVKEYHAGAKGSAEAKFQLVVAAIEALRKQPQPALNKALLERLGVLPSGRLRLPLEPMDAASVDEAAKLLESMLGLRFPAQA